MYAVYEQTRKFECVVWGVGKTKEKAQKEALECLKDFCGDFNRLHRDPSEKKHHCNSVKEKRLIAPLTISRCTKEFAKYIDNYGGHAVFFLRVNGTLTLNVKRIINVLNKLASDIKKIGKLKTEHKSDIDDLIAIAHEIGSQREPKDYLKKIRRP